MGRARRVPRMKAPVETGRISQRDNRREEGQPDHQPKRGITTLGDTTGPSAQNPSAVRGVVMSLTRSPRRGSSLWRHRRTHVFGANWTAAPEPMQLTAPTRRATRSPSRGLAAQVSANPATTERATGTTLTGTVSPPRSKRGAVMYESSESP
jgi:hypothetical protein